VQVYIATCTGVDIIYNYSKTIIDSILRPQCTTDYEYLLAFVVKKNLAGISLFCLLSSSSSSSQIFFKVA